MKIFNKLKKLSIILSIILLVLLFPINSAFASENYVYLGGNVLGFTLQTEGATVVGLCDVITDKGVTSPCENAGIQVGDIILSMNGKLVNNANDIAGVISKYKEGCILTKISRNQKVKLVEIFPAIDVSGVFKLGLFIRDDLSGLGTVTYYKEDGSFASLGHPVCDNNGALYNVISGKVYQSSIIGVNKAQKGKAGELRGIFTCDKEIGKINVNTKVGLYGCVYKFNPQKHTKIYCEKAVQGKAQIYSTIDGVIPKFYNIEIVKTDLNSKSNKNLVIKITDKDLLNYTGGILQGMSGSPIIQNGKLVGAVTHVFLNDSTRGYGISIMNMLR